MLPYWQPTGESRHPRLNSKPARSPSRAAGPHLNSRAFGRAQFLSLPCTRPRFLMTAEKVLIVEDEENERNGLAELIGAWGYKTETARDGVEGLEKLESWNPG